MSRLKNCSPIAAITWLAINILVNFISCPSFRKDPREKFSNPLCLLRAGGHDNAGKSRLHNRGMEENRRGGSHGGTSCDMRKPERSVGCDERNVIDGHGDGRDAAKRYFKSADCRSRRRSQSA